MRKGLPRRGGGSLELDNVQDEMLYRANLTLPPDSSETSGLSE
ncbi:MAG: hypothetical protein O6949_01975 [Chloroflexi bacterium]|nr:hypothetical protein [Chloroflexota bacterium]